jgi:hypothetical protein
MRNWWALLKHNWLLSVGIMLLKSPPLSPDIMGIFLKRKLLWVFMPCKAQGEWALQESGPNARC